MRITTADYVRFISKTECSLKEASQVNSEEFTKIPHSNSFEEIHGFLLTHKELEAAGEINTTDKGFAGLEAKFV